jgi:carboxypeptidase family protein
MRIGYAVLAILLPLLAPAATAQDFGSVVFRPQGLVPLVSGPSTPGGHVSADPSQTCSVEGVVLKSTTGEPIKKIAITINPASGGSQSSSAITDVNGHFLFSGLTPGRYVMSAGGNGYPYQVYGQKGRHGPPKLLELQPGQQVRDIVFHVAPGGVITGTVYDEDGDPVVNAQVMAMRFATSGKSQQVASMTGGQTNDLGEYRIYGLDPGQYFIAANGPPPIQPNGQSDEVYLSTFHPSTPDPSQSVAVQLRPGDEVTGVDVSLLRVHAARVDGRLLSGVDGKPVRNAYVSMMPRDTKFAGMPFNNYGAGVDDKGNFEVHGVPPGSYALMSSWNDPNGTNKPYFARATIEVADADVDGIQLILSPGMEVRGRVHTDPGAKLDYTRLNLWLQPTENMMWGGTSAEIKADGAFVFRNVSDGKYRLHVAGFPEEFYVKSARWGGSEALDSGLEVGHGQSAGALDVELTLTGGHVDGVVVQNQKPVPGALVALVPDPPYRDRDDMFSSKLTDAMGRFSLLGLPPGDFKLFAWERTDGMNFRDPEFQSAYENRGTPVHIKEREGQTVQLELITVEEEAQ